MPQRPGHGTTGGRYIESQVMCDAGLIKAGLGTAKASPLLCPSYAPNRPFALPRTLVVGVSAGGSGVLVCKQ